MLPLILLFLDYFVATLMAVCLPITRAGLLILDPSYVVGNLTNSEFAETKALEPLKS
jgi:hypothetical protein